MGAQVGVDGDFGHFTIEGSCWCSFNFLDTNGEVSLEHDIVAVVGWVLVDTLVVAPPNFIIDSLDKDDFEDWVKNLRLSNRKKQK